ncbi:hypothetical protein PENTCL1PPCAC_22407, partial [Pristionchus entomophagus]
FQVTEATYDVEYRKAAIVLGVVEAGAELLVWEVKMWGAKASMQQQFVNGNGRNERREVRKQIASVLTNLTFGSASMKRLVAEYDQFMPVVIQIIEAAPNLVPPYANLLRNVSWPSCKGMVSLFAATPALTKAAVEAHLRGDDKSVKSTLSAIWNMVGSGGEECVRRVVEMEGCVDMLIQLLVMDAQRTLVVEYSTGILKYASAELVRGEKLEHCIVIRDRLLSRLLPLLRASSMTIVKNALGAVSEVAAKDPISVRKSITQSAMESLEKLQRSNDNEIRRPAKAILSLIGTGNYNGVMSRSAHVGNGRDMSSSLHSNRLLPRRSPYCSPSAGGGGGGGIVNGEMDPSIPSSSTSPRASSVPRLFHDGVRGGGGGGMSTNATPSTGGEMGIPFGVNGPPTLQFEQEEEEGERDDDYYDDEDDELSTQVTRAGSIEDLDEDGQSQDISGFHSTVETANNSCRLSPVSYSDLPDSPTQCAAIRDAALRENTLQLNLPSFSMPSSTNGDTEPFGVGPSSSAGGSSGTDGSSGGLSSSQTHSSHTTPHGTSAEQTPTYSTINARYTMDYAPPRIDEHRIAASAAAANSAPSTSNDIKSVFNAKNDEEEDDYGIYGEEDILDRSIQEALPQRIDEKRERLNSFLLDSLSSSLPSHRSPSSKGSSRYSNTSTIREDDILAAAIESAMPKIGSLSSPRGTLLQQPKNGEARWSEREEREERPRKTTEGPMMSDRREKREEEEESDESDLEDGLFPMGGSLVGTMPRDVEEEIEAERIAIDCSSLKRKPRPPRTSLLPRQLATPTSRTARQTTPTASTNGRPSPRPSSIGRPCPLTSTPNNSRTKLSKYPSTPRVSAVTLSLSGTPNGNSLLEAPPPSSNGTPPTASSDSMQTTPSSSSSSMSRLKKPTASAVVPPYNYQIPKSTPREEKKGSCLKGGKEVEKTRTNGEMLVTTLSSSKSTILDLL